MNQYDPPGGLPWGLFGLCSASLLLNLVLGLRLLTAPAVSADVQPEPVLTEAVAVVSPEVAVVRAEPVPQEAERVEPVSALPDGTRAVRVKVEHSLARTFDRALGDEGRFVSANVSRLFAFELDLRRHLQAGDRIDVVWSGQGKELIVVAARLESARKGTLTAFQFQPQGARFPSWFNADGEDVSLTLKHTPIADYEQITSLLKDRPNHKGMDFKADVGTPILASFAGTVTRTNWNHHANGNCVELQFRDGTTARYLHLSQTGVQPGERVEEGAVLGLSGNTGRSTAPHLHYEMSKNDDVVDPIDHHGTHREVVSDADREGFRARRDELVGWLNEAH